MLTEVEKSKVFSQYNLLVVVVFLLIVFSAYFIATVRYFSDLTDLKKAEIEVLNQQVDTVNDVLSSNVNALQDIQKFANYFLKYPEELLTKTPVLSQEGDHYYIKHRHYDVLDHKDYVRNNITGIGDINSLSKAHKEELAMANMLTPAFVSTKQANKEAVWLYYVSKKRFVSIYPSINRNSWQYNDALLEGEHTRELLENELDDKSVIWSTPYSSTAGTGLNASIGISVFNRAEMVGIIFMDISLARLQQNLDEISQKNTGLLILDRNNNVLVHHTLNKDMVKNIGSWEQLAPAGLSSLTSDQINDLGVYQEIDGLLVQKKILSINGWKVIKYQSYNDFREPLLTHYIINFCVLFIGVFLFLVFVYLITHFTFVKPTKRFISHIEYCAQGDPGKIKPTSDWLRWYQVVENIFGQNRSLLQRLTDQNLLLDSLVNVKTKELQEKIVQHERDYALLTSVMNAIPEYIIFTNTEGDIVGFNNAFGDFIGKTRQDVLGYKANEIIHSELGTELTKLSTSPQVKDGLQRIIQTGDKTYDIYCSNIHSDTGIEVGTIDIIRDVTAQYTTQAALEKTRDQAEFANKAKSQFLANMSHEIRTPINAMQGMITLLGRSDLTNNQRLHIDNAYGASKSLLYLVDQLLDLAKIESGEMTIVKERTSIDSIIDKAINLNIGMINKKQLDIFVDISPAVPLFIETDEMRLIQVLTNLLQNSVKFTESGGIKITLDIIHQNVLCFKVKDTGIGIALEKQSHLFEAFKQADESMTRRYGGSGLGLSICQQIVELLGGDISLESEIYQGCEFTVELPYIESDETTQHLASRALTIYNFGISLPNNILESIKTLGWKYQNISTLEQLETVSKDESIVLLASQDSLQNIISTNTQEIVELLCIFQNKEQSINIEEPILEQLTVPYILQEQPLYRHMLLSISKTLSRIKKAALSEAIREKESLTGVRVLLVEDNLVNQLVARELLVSMKAEVIIAENGKVALDLLEKNTIDIVLMDIQMPVMDGLTATRLIREQDKFKDLPIIAMTAHAREEDRDNSLAAGMNLHMAKPVRYESLLTQILTLVR
ncbi:ATP-binding protein [Pseudocolwellia sp. HL-MZ7]|uniref:ATP-binding protein n=1 Tax=Pseudocolwellia sp. HL-MZ7 TaxID=3400627 RepID=UPI003CFB05F0